MLYSLEELNEGDKIVCPACGGDFKKYYSKFVPGPMSPGWVSIKEICRTCKGRGLVKIKLEPIEG